jgi:hypothetical protein
MINVKHVILGLMVVLITGCASIPNNWENMSEREITAWKQLDQSAEQAQTWKAADFSAEQAADWITQGIDTETAEEWRHKEFSATEAKTWIDADFTVKKAVSYREKGLSPIASEGNSEGDSENNATASTVCTEPRADMCTREYRPVCGLTQDGTRKDYSNGCTACADATVESWEEGLCSE